MTAIRTHDDEHDVSCDADALDALQGEVERNGASGADVGELAGKILGARENGYGTGISTSCPAVAVLTTNPCTPEQAFIGYWQPDGSWRDVFGGPGSLELAQTISDYLSSGHMLTPGAVLSVKVNFQSFTGESPESRTWTRESIENGVNLPICRSDR